MTKAEAAEVQALLNQIDECLMNIELQAGEPGPNAEFDNDLRMMNVAVTRMGAECDKIRASQG